MLIERELDIYKICGANILEARDWLIWKDVPTNHMVSYMFFGEQGRLRETTHLP